MSVFFFFFSVFLTGPWCSFFFIQNDADPIYFDKCHLQAYFAANAAAQASRKSSPRVTNEEVQKAVST
jgi:5-methyltetrahydropteroyltriglutamate--homocysteine methyltransferase